MTNNETAPAPEKKVVQLDLNKIKLNLPIYSSQKLCEMIACDRYFGMSQHTEENISALCMQELANRRIAGAIFPFEQVIEECFNKLPPLNLNMPDLKTTLTQLVNMNKKP
jgi:hypothetical protein